MTTIVIRNQPNSCFTRWPCALCNGTTEKQAYLFEIVSATGIAGRQPSNPLAAMFGRPGRVIICDDCAEHPEYIPERIRVAVGELREEANQLEVFADCGFTTEVVPVPDDWRSAQDGLYSENDFPNWMRERLGLPPMTENDFGERIPV